MKTHAETYDELRQLTEAGIDRLLPPADTRPASLHAAMRYSMDAGGKRLRPVLVLGTAQCLGAAPEDALPAAVAIECLHSYTLIHDDLPCMDDSDLRRGRPSCHKQFDEATALLAGDGLLTYAFELLGHHYAHRPALAAALAVDLARGSGSQGVIGGQVEDLIADKGEISAERLDYIHLHKTAALISTALRMGARIGGADATALATVTRVGQSMGLVFQIVDDVLDMTATPEQMGKPTGADAVHGKLTYPRLHGLDASRQRIRALNDEARVACRTLPGDTTFLEWLIDSMAERVR